MSQPETKTVLGRVFTWNATCKTWDCDLKREQLLVLHPPRAGIRDNWGATLWEEVDEVTVAEESGPTEKDAILALQSTLRKMAELEVTPNA